VECRIVGQLDALHKSRGLSFRLKLRLVACNLADSNGLWGKPFPTGMARPACGREGC
jgi:hypothetical protein